MFNNSQDLLILHKNEHQGLDLINERIQTILPFFIEGASPIESGDPRWTFFILLRFMPSSSQLNIFSPEKKIKYGSKHIAQDSSSYSDGLYSTDSISYHHKSSSNIMIKPLGTESSTVGEKKFFKDESEAFENNKSSFHSLGGHDKNGNITSHLNVDQKQIHSPQILAYCSCYDFFRFPNGIRRRISQFITLFPFQKCGFGSILYRHIIYQSSGIPSALGPIHSSLTQNNDSKNFINSHHEPNSLSTTNENNSAKLNALQTSEKTLTKEMKADVHEKIEPYHLQTENIKEISVEDPSPAFSDFRLINDTRLLIENHEKSAEDFKFSPLQVSECNLALNYIRGELKDSDLKRHVLKKHQESIPLASGKERSQIIKTLMDKERCRLRKLFVDYTKIHNTPVPLESTT